MSYIAAGGTCVACPSFIGLTGPSGGGPPPPSYKTYWSQNFYAGRYWNSNFWNGHQAVVPPGTGQYFQQNYFKGNFWKSLFYRA